MVSLPCGLHTGSYVTTVVAVRLGASARGTRSTRRRGHIGAAGPLGLGAGPAGGTHGQPGGAGHAPFDGKLATHGAVRVEVVDVAAAGVVGLVLIGHRTASSSSVGRMKRPGLASRVPLRCSARPRSDGPY